MTTLKYLGPHDAVEVPSLNWRSFPQGEVVDVGDADLGALREQSCWEVDGVAAVAPQPVPEPPVDTTTPENQPTEPTEAPAEPAPTEGS
jgi:hypothetical protein